MPKKVKSVWELVAENKTGAAFAQISGDLGKTNKAFNALSAGAGLIKGAVVGAVGLFAAKAFQSADATAKLALKLNSTTEALSQLNYVADRSGVSTQSVSNALRDMGKNASLAAAGKGEAKDALLELGISAERFKSLQAEDQLLVMAQALQSIEDPADKSRLAMQVMGESGSEMIKVMAGGPGPIRDLMREADSLGLTLKTGTSKAAERAADAMTKITASGKALQVTLVNVLGPSVAYIANAIGNSLPEAVFIARKSIVTLRAMGTDAASSLYSVSGFFSDLASNLPFVGEAFAKDAVVAKQTAADLKDLAAVYQDEFLGMRFSIEDYTAAVSDSADTTGVLNDELKGLAGRQCEEAAAAAAGAAAAKEAAKKRAEAAKVVAAELAAVERRIATIYEETRTPVEEYSAAIQELLALRGEGLDDDTFTRAVIRAQERLEGLAETAEETGAELTEFGKQAAANVQTQFADFLFDPFEAGLGGMLDGFVTTLRRMAAEAAAQQIFDKFGGAEGVGAVLNSLFGGLIPGRATGGPMAAGMPYWAGEHGRELIVPVTNSRAIPAGGAGVTINNNINVSAPNGQVDRRSLQQLQAAAGEATSRALARNR
jgi:hypothetical protein